MRYTLFLIFLMTAVGSHAQFVLNGRISNYKGAFIYLQYLKDNGTFVKDSVGVKNGVFTFTGDCREPFMAVLRSSSNFRSIDDTGSISLFLEPRKMMITLAGGNFVDARLEGSASQKQYGADQLQMTLVQKRWKTVMDTLSAVNKRDNFQFQALKNWVLTPYHTEMDGIINTSMRQYPGSYVTANYLRYRAAEMNADTLNKWYAGLNEKVKQSKFGKNLYEEIQKKSIGIPGTVAKVFTSEDIDGKPLSLSDLKGRYVLLDFWASWCLPCRKGNPHLKELYTKYKGKGLEIIGIADDDSHPDAWRNAVEKDGTAIWKHILRGMKKTEKGYDHTADISDFYNIHSLPTKILIGPDGKIIGRFVSDEDAAMDQQLAGIFEQ